MDAVDGPCELLIRRSMDKLLAEHFCNREIPGPNRIVLNKVDFGNSRAQHTAYGTSPFGPIYKSESRDSLFRNETAKHRPII